MNTGGRAKILVCLLAGVMFLHLRVYASEQMVIEAPYWDTDDSYRPPNFNVYFSDSAKGAEALSAWWAASDREEQSSSDVVAMLRQGLRRYEGDRAAILRWAGRRFVDPPYCQDALVIEIMYHASDSRAPDDIRGPAIRYGLTSVRPMTPNILSTLAALSMASENPDELARIARGIDGHRDEALSALTIYLESEDDSVREKAVIVNKLWRRELKAHDWARARKLEQTEVAFRDQLPAIRESLRTGSSSLRRQTLDLIAENDILLIMPDSAVAWLAKCATDPEAEVRAHAARLIGERWILNASNQNTVAVELVLKLSMDDARPVRHNAVYYGLSVVSPKNDTVILGLLEVAAESSGELSERIAWGLRGYRPRVRVLLDGWIASEEGARSEAGARLYRALVE